MKIAPPLSAWIPIAALLTLQALLIASLAETFAPRTGSARTSISAENTSFDSGSNFVTFEDSVRLENASMTLTCDVLEVEMNRGQRAATLSSPSNIKVAVAKGYVVIHTENDRGKPVTATARHARYETESDIVVLTNFPKIQDGAQEVVGTSPDTKIFLSNDGHYRVEGPNRTTILQNNLPS